MKKVKKASAVTLNEAIQDMQLVFNGSSKKEAPAMFNGTTIFDTSKFSDFIFYDFIEVLNESLKDCKKMNEFSLPKSKRLKQRRKISVRELFKVE